MEYNFKGTKEYAALKNVPLRKIHSLIDRGIIEAVKVSGRLAIDMDKYGDLDVNEHFAHQTKALKLEADVKQLKAKIKALERIVLVGNENGRGPAKETLSA